MIGPYLVTTEPRWRETYGPPCGAKATAGTALIDGRNLKCRVEAVEPFEAWEQVRAVHGYRLTGTDTGIYSCRHMRHNNLLPWSVHAWGGALDVNWLENPAGSKLVTDLPAPMRADLLALRTVSGARVFRWGGDWDFDGMSSDHDYIDAMHWEVVAHPLDLATGIAGAPAPEGNEMLPLTATSPEEDIRSLQDRLNRAYGLSLKEDGIYGSSTETAVKDHLLGFTGDTSETAKAGKRVNANMWNGLTEDWMRRAVGGGSGAVDAYTKAQSDQKYAAQVHPHSATTKVT